MTTNIGPAPGTSSEIDILMSLPPHELKARGIRFKHFLAVANGRLVATVATRELADGSVQATAAIVNPNQGRSDGEQSPSRRGGRLESLRRLLEAKDNKTFTPEQAKCILAKKVQDYRSTDVRPSDIQVVIFQKDQLRSLLRERQIFQFFPGAKWVPPPHGLRGRVNYRPRKSKVRSLLSRFTAFFR